MSGFGTGDVIEWRAAPPWALGWLAVHLFFFLPFLAFGAWLAANEIADAPEGTWPAYLFFLGALATLILGGLTLAILAGAVSLALLLFDSRPVLHADRQGVEVRMPLRPTRVVSWKDISAIQMERTREVGRRTVHFNHIIFRLRDAAAPELTFRPQMTGQTLEAALDALQRLYARFR